MLLIDSDVVLDAALERGEFADPAWQLLDLVEHGTEAAAVSWHAISNVNYWITKVRDRHEARRFIVDLIEFVSVPETGGTALRYALELPMTDFEDAMQAAAAWVCGADFIVTRNERHFRQSPILAIAPSEAIRRLS